MSLLKGRQDWFSLLWNYHMQTTIKPALSKATSANLVPVPLVGWLWCGFIPAAIHTFGAFSQTAKGRYEDSRTASVGKNKPLVYLPDVYLRNAVFILFFYIANC